MYKVHKTYITFFDNSNQHHHIIIITSHHGCRNGNQNPRRTSPIMHARFPFQGKEALHVRWSIDRGATPIGAQPTSRKPFCSAARFSRPQIDIGASGCSCTDFAGLSLDRHIMMGEALYNVASNARKKLLPRIAMCINIERHGYNRTIPNKNTE